MKNIEFWFSIGSTYTYLSVTRILDVEKKHQVKFSWKPFSVRKIMKEMDNIPFPPNKKNKVDYMWRDIERRAKFYDFFANVYSGSTFTGCRCRSAHCNRLYVDVRQTRRVGNR